MHLVIFPAIDAARLARVIEAAGAGCQMTNAADRQTALAAMSSADGFFGKLTPELLAAAPQLRWVQSPTASLEHYLFPALIEHPSVLTNMRGIFSDVIADHVLGYVLSFARNLHLYRDQQRSGRWDPVGGGSALPNFTVGPGQATAVDLAHLHLADCTLGVVGVGAIGAEICRRARAFGMRVLGVDPHPRSIDNICDVAPLDQLPRLLAESHFVVIAAPHTPHTEHLFGAKTISLMRPRSYLINIGRGVIVELAALVDALRSGHLAGAALDVSEIEPLPPTHPLWQMPNVLITPHVAAASPRVPERHAEVLVENVRRFAHNEPLLNVVNKREWY